MFEEIKKKTVNNNNKITTGSVFNPASRALFSIYTEYKGRYNYGIK